MFATNRFVTLITVVSVAFISSGCATTYRTVGPYEVVLQGGGLLCQSRLEFYFTGSSSGSNKEHIYLGACGTSQGLMRELSLSPSSGDRSCFGIAEDGASMVYLHKPRICGGGERGARKPGGVYLHTAREGDRLLYPEFLIYQVWYAADTRQNPIRVKLVGCSGSFVINANGEEKCEVVRGPY